MAPSPSRKNFFAQHITTTTPAADEPGCPICFETYNQKEHHAVTFSDFSSCNHIFCMSCLCKWLTERGVNKCPMCRRVLFTLDYAENEDSDSDADELEEEEEEFVRNMIEQQRQDQHIEHEEPRLRPDHFIQIIAPQPPLVNHPIPAAPRATATQWPFSLNPFIQTPPPSPHPTVAAAPRRVPQLHPEQYVDHNEIRPAENQRTHLLDTLFHILLPVPPLAHAPIPAAHPRQEQQDTRPATTPSDILEDTFEHFSTALLSGVERLHRRVTGARLAVERLQERTRIFVAVFEAAAARSAVGSESGGADEGA